jgi:hypothetical protein
MECELEVDPTLADTAPKSLLSRVVSAPRRSER